MFNSTPNLETAAFTCRLEKTRGFSAISGLESSRLGCYVDCWVVNYQWPSERPLQKIEGCLPGTAHADRAPVELAPHEKTAVIEAQGVRRPSEASRSTTMSLRAKHPEAFLKPVFLFFNTQLRLCAKSPATESGKHESRVP